MFFYATPRPDDKTLLHTLVAQSGKRNALRALKLLMSRDKKLMVSKSGLRLVA